jgi:hypothetical protein
MATLYKVWQRVTGPNDPKAFCNSMKDDGPYGPWLTCDHNHPSDEEAAICRDFGSER